jgi:hypothetical protein
MPETFFNLTTFTTGDIKLFENTPSIKEIHLRETNFTGEIFILSLHELE